MNERPVSSTPAPLNVCDDVNGKHVWSEPFTDGDTCACGRFYLDLHPAHGFVAMLVEAPVYLSPDAP